MSFEFGDKILFKGNPAIFLHYEDSLLPNSCWISFVKADHECSGYTQEQWVDVEDIIGVEEVSGHPKEISRKLRDSILFIYGQLASLQFHVDTNAFDNLEVILSRYKEVTKRLFHDTSDLF